MKTNLKQLILGLTLIQLLTSCSGAPSKVTAEEQPDKVLARSDGLSERPAWVKESEMFRLDTNDAISLGMATIPASHRLEAAYRVALNNAKAGIVGAIDQKLDYIFQNAEEGTDVDPQRIRYIGTEASHLASASIRPAHFYWEKVATTTDAGERITQYRVFAAVRMPAADFRRAVIGALRAGAPKAGLSEEFAKKADEKWDRMAQESTAEVKAVSSREPASTTK